MHPRLPAKTFTAQALHWTVLALLSAALPACSATSGHGPATVPPTPTIPKITPVVNTSRWGQAVNGLRASLVTQTQVEQNDHLPISLLVTFDSASLAQGITRFDPRRVSLSLLLRHNATGKTFTIKPYDSGMPAFLPPDAGVPLDDQLSRTYAEPFLLRQEKMPPGEYDCTVSLTAEPIADQKSLWSGTIASAPLRIKILPEVLRPYTFDAPTQLAFSDMGDVRFLQTGSQKVQTMLGNGLTIGTMVSRDGQMQTLFGGPPSLVPSVANAKGSPPNGTKVSYTVEVFATPISTGHFWSPYTTEDKGFKTLWKKTFVVPTPTGVK